MIQTISKFQFIKFNDRIQMGSQSTDVQIRWKSPESMTNLRQRQMPVTSQHRSHRNVSHSRRWKTQKWRLHNSLPLHWLKVPTKMPSKTWVYCNRRCSRYSINRSCNCNSFKNYNHNSNRRTRKVNWRNRHRRNPSIVRKSWKIKKVRMRRHHLHHYRRQRQRQRRS